jgi:hypothetical protein
MRLAADQGLGVALLVLGELVRDGRGGPRDLVQAHMLFDVALVRLPASQTEARARAQSGRDGVAARMTPAQVEEAQRLAREWKPR